MTGRHTVVVINGSGTVRDVMHESLADGALQLVRAGRERHDAISFRAAVESMPDGFAILSAVRDGAGQITDFRYDYINPRGAELNGRGVDEHLDRTLRQLSPDPATSSLVSSYAQVVSTGRATELHEVDLTDRSGAATVFEIRVTRHGDGVAVVWRDVTASVRDRRELAEDNRRLRQANEDLEWFVRMTAHDLQNPLAASKGFLDLLERQEADRLTDAGRLYLERVRTTGDRIRRFLEELLTWARTSAPARIVPCDLEQLTCDVLLEFAISLEEAGAVVDITPMPVVRTDPTVLTPVLANLVRNALVHAEPQVPLRIVISAVRNEDGTVVVSVCDNGRGIAVDDVERVFEPFRQVATEGKGTGIGLAICRRHLERLGGHIWAEPSPSGGTVFRFSLPPSDGAA